MQNETPGDVPGGSSALKYHACAQDQASRNSPDNPGNPADPAEAVQELRLRPYLHAPGARMPVA